MKKGKKLEFPDIFAGLKGVYHKCDKHIEGYKEIHFCQEITYTKL